MVSLSDIQASNARVATSLPPGLVGVFVGATTGIGETTLRQFVKYARQPRVYFVGRTQDAGDRIMAECKALNPGGEYIFIKADVSLIQTVDDVCQEIKAKEKVVNILMLSTATLVTGTETSERLHLGTALLYYSRVRFIMNLLPLLQQAPALRRVVTVFAGGKEGRIDTSDFQALHASLLSVRGHISSMITLSLEAIAQKAPDVTFIHEFPGNVKTNLINSLKGVVPIVIKAIYSVIGPFVYIPIVESGDRHLFLATSARYKPAEVKDLNTSGVPLAKGVQIARGTNGKVGSGVYSVNWDMESSGPKVDELLATLRREGMVEKVWKHTEGEFERIAAMGEQK